MSTSKLTNKAQQMLEEGGLSCYVYVTDAFKDLMDCVIEYLGETEHHSGTAPEISARVVGDVAEFRERRKYELLVDFIEYWIAAIRGDD